MEYDSAFALKQLMYTGMLETTRIRREGYAFRIPFAEFFRRYRGICFPFGDDLARYAHSNDWRHNLAAQFRVPANERQRGLVRELLENAAAAAEATGKACERIRSGNIRKIADGWMDLSFCLCFSTNKHVLL